MQNQRGFIGIGVLIAIILGLAVVGGGAYFVVQQKSSPQTATDTENLNVPFVADNKVQQQTNNRSSENVTTTNSTLAQWKTYTNSKHGFSIQYPGNRDWVPQELADTAQAFAVFIGLPNRNASNIHLTVSILNKDAYINVSTLVAAKGRSLIDRKESRENITINGVPALLVTVAGTTSSDDEPAKYVTEKSVFIERNGKIYAIERDSRTDSADFMKFYNSFKFTSPDSSTSASQSISSVPTLNTGIINITSPNGGETLRIGDTVRITWEAKNVPSGAQVDLELFKITSEKTSVSAEGACLNCAGGGLLSGVSAIYPIANGTGGADWIVGKLYSGGYVSSGNRYIMKAQISRTGSENECPNPGHYCTIIAGVDWSDVSFTLVN